MTSREVISRRIALFALALTAACADSPTAPRVETRVASYSIGEVPTGHINPLRAQGGKVFVCLFTSASATNFAYHWRLTDDSTGVVFSEGVRGGVASNQCVTLVSVPRNPRAVYSLLVQEEVGRPANFLLTGLSFSLPPDGKPIPPFQIDFPRRRFTTKITNRYGISIGFHNYFL